MKKFFLIVFIILLIGTIWKVFFTPCKLEKTKVHQIARPIVKAFANHIDKNGMPKSLDDVKGIKYTLVSCKGNQRVEGCYGSDDRRYFTLKKDEYSFWGYSHNEYIYSFSIVHNDTQCDYQIFLDKDKKGLSGMKNYSIPRCFITCPTLWRQ